MPCRQSQPHLPLPAAHLLPARRAASLGEGALNQLPPPHLIALHARRHGLAPVLSPPLSYNDMVHMPGSKYRWVSPVTLLNSSYLLAVQLCTCRSFHRLGRLGTALVSI